VNGTPAIRQGNAGSNPGADYHVTGRGNSSTRRERKRFDRPVQHSATTPDGFRHGLSSS
jgi:hypothetical protein